MLNLVAPYWLAEEATDSLTLSGATLFALRTASTPTHTHTSETGQKAPAGRTSESQPASKPTGQQASRVRKVQVAEASTVKHALHKKPQCVVCASIPCLVAEGGGTGGGSHAFFARLSTHLLRANAVGSLMP